MHDELVGAIKTKMQERTTDELLAIWTTNDREKWSEQAFEAISQVLTERRVTLPAQDLAPDVQRKLDVTKQLEQLPALPVNNAIRIDRYFRAWSALLILWIIAGFGNIGLNFKEMDEYKHAIANIKMASTPFYSVKPEFAEVVNRLSPHVPALERLNTYFLVTAIISIPAWALLFPIRTRFVRRQRQGPQYLLILLAVEVGIHSFGVFLSAPIPATATMDVVDIDLIRTYPVAIGLVMLTLMPFFSKTARLFYRYTKIDPMCFTKKGEGINILKRKVDS